MPCGPAPTSRTPQGREAMSDRNAVRTPAEAHDCCWSCTGPVLVGKLSTAEEFPALTEAFFGSKRLKKDGNLMLWGCMCMRRRGGAVCAGRHSGAALQHAHAGRASWHRRLPHYCDGHAAARRWPGSCVCLCADAYSGAFSSVLYACQCLCMHEGCEVESSSWVVDLGSCSKEGGLCWGLVWAGKIEWCVKPDLAARR
jgi:hypothetical protein